MYFQYLKAIHIIFVTTWFAGLFYIVRLFVYFAETDSLASPEKEILQKQYRLMQQRLWYIITWPSALITALMGTLLVIEYGMIPGWLWIKLSFVLALFIYHFICHKIFKDQQRGLSPYTSQQMRLWNEVATVLLVGIIFIVVLKNALSMVWGLVGLVILSFLMMLGIKIYKILREK
ncbi:MAG TPA: CopD family protein [Cytophagaceae bacterium]|nr:CopD family protein [Cytophagaceae bacterium]